MGSVDRSIDEDFDERTCPSEVDCIGAVLYSHRRIATWTLPQVGLEALGHPLRMGLTGSTYHKRTFPHAEVCGSTTHHQARTSLQANALCNGWASPPRVPSHQLSKAKTILTLSSMSSEPTNSARVPANGIFLIFPSLSGMRMPVMTWSGVRGSMKSRIRSLFRP